MSHYYINVPYINVKKKKGGSGQQSINIYEEINLPFSRRPVDPVLVCPTSKNHSSTIFIQVAAQFS